MTTPKKRRRAKPQTEDDISLLIEQCLALAQQQLAVAEDLHRTYEPPQPDRSVIHVATAAELEQALATVVGPADIRIAPGSVYPGNFVLRNRADAGMVNLRADLEDSAILPSGGVPWITPTQAANFPKLAPLDPGLPILRCEDGAHHYHLFGLEFMPNTAHPDMTLVELGRGDITALNQAPYLLEVDCCYIHGDPATGCRRGVSLQSSQTTIQRSYISECWYSGQDAQAIAVWTSPGELVIAHNYLAGSGENVIIGGADPKIPDLVPTDITVMRNYIVKPPAWRSHPGSVKNLFELKNARSVTIEENVFEGCWVDAQPGHAIVLTVRNQDGGAPWSTIQDVTFRWNVVKDVEGSFVNILGIDDIHPSVRANCLTIEQNLFYNGGGGIQSLSGFLATHIGHNSITGPDWKWLSLGGAPLPPNQLTLVDNAVPPTEYGITGDDCGIGTPSLDRYAPGSDMRCNAIGMKGWVPYPDGNYCLPMETPPADYQAQAATDGTTTGVNLEELAKRIPWYPLPV